MTAEHIVTVERSFAHPIAQVFRRYTDHEGWSGWAGLGKVRLVQEGSPLRDGAGAVRSFSLAPGLREEITRFDPEERLDYRVVQGAYPITDHRAEVLFTPEGQGTRVTWRVSFRSKLPGAGGAVAAGLKLLFRRVLGRLERDLAAHPS